MEAFNAWLKQVLDAFPDQKYEPVAGFEDGNTAIDEGYFTGTSTGPSNCPEGKRSLPPASH